MVPQGKFVGAAGAAPPLSAVIFDVGNVLVEWNPRHLYRKLFADDAATMEHFLATVCTAEWNACQDAGRPFAEGVAELSARFPEHAALIVAYDRRWEEMVPFAHDETLAVVDELSRQGLALFALTNFSREKFPLMRARFPVFRLFNGIIVSGEIGLIKPDPRIYQHLLKEFDLQPSGCLFIDDSPANIAAARALGLQTHHYQGGLALRRALQTLGVL